MITLYLTVEGRSEEEFVNKTLGPYLMGIGYEKVSCRLIRTSKRSNKREHKGRLVKYEHLRNDIQRWKGEHKRRENVFFSMMVDFYAFPEEDSPYSKEIRLIGNKKNRVEELEKAISEDIGFYRFIPYIQLHEFESFLFVDNLSELAKEMDINHSLIRPIIDGVSGLEPEEINDGFTTAPSKRIEKVIENYSKFKRTGSPLSVHKIGIEKLRERMPHFDSWLTKLEDLIVKAGK